MRRHVMMLVALAAPAAAAAMQAPRDQSPAPRELLQAMGLGNSDEELERQVAEAARHPLGTNANPVRVGGPEGERAYIARLRCSDGTLPKIGTRSSAGVGAFGTITDVYPLDCGAAGPGKFSLVMDMYHEEHRESRAPAGFSITP